MSDTNSSLPLLQTDEETKLRIGHLALVGKALRTLSSESAYQTDFYVAKESLNKFKERLILLDLPAETIQGMNDLIEYLQKKIDKRMKASVEDYKM